MNRRDRKILKSIEKLSERLAEDQLYQIVADELEEGFVDGVASLRANEISEGNKEKAESIYPKQRIRRLLDLRSELSVIESIHNESKKEKKPKAINEKEGIYKEKKAVYLGELGVAIPNENTTNTVRKIDGKEPNAIFFVVGIVLFLIIFFSFLAK
tara:strand:+ start:1108 stop:1575 length:468 start_codon:yes stop_codon:yes gene_type:complete